MQCDTLNQALDAHTGAADQNVLRTTLSSERALQGYLTHKKRPHRRILQYDHPQGHMVALGGGLFHYEQITPVARRAPLFTPAQNGSDHNAFNIL